MTSPTIGRLSGGPCRHGVAVTSIEVLPGASSQVLCQNPRPRTSPSSRAAPDSVVTIVPAPGSSARPAGSRLSSWCSWVSSTASIGPMSCAAIAGPASFTDPVPQPKR